WQPDERPLEIGLPTRLAAVAAAARHELRVLDLPGLFAAGEYERNAARDMVSRFAPVMKLVIFVQQVDKMADAFNDPAIRDNPYLSQWAELRDRYRIVLTRAFKDASLHRRFRELRQQTADPAQRTSEKVADLVRRHLAKNLAESMSERLSADDL